MKLRKIVQISAFNSPESPDSVYALCDDNTLWRGTWDQAKSLGKRGGVDTTQWNFTWGQLPEVPQPTMKGKK